MYKYKSGGKTYGSNKQMLANQSVELKHHSEELIRALDDTDEVDAWVVAKAERASTDLSDITHYLDGRKQSMADGGETSPVSDAKEKIRLFIAALPSALNEKGYLDVEYLMESASDYVFKIFSNSIYPVNRASGKLQRAGLKVEKTGVSTEKLLNVPKTIVDAMGEKKRMAKGGVIWVDSKMPNYQHYYHRFNNAIGSFAWKYDGYHEGILYQLDEYDIDFYDALISSLKKGEYLLRYKTDRMPKSWGGSIIKLNLEKSLIYFLRSEEEQFSEKIPMFETRGQKAEYIIVEYDMLYPEHVFALGGISEEANNKNDDCILKIIDKVNDFKSIEDYYIVDKQLVIILEDELYLYDMNVLNDLLKSINHDGITDDEFGIGYKEAYKTLLLDLHTDDFTIGKYSHGGVTAEEYMENMRRIKKMDDISVLEWANQVIEAHSAEDDEEMSLLSDPASARKFLTRYYTEEIEPMEVSEEASTYSPDMGDLPDELKELLDEYDEVKFDNLSIAKLRKKFNAVGYTFDVSEDLRPINIRQVDTIDYFKSGGDTGVKAMKGSKMELGGETLRKKIHENDDSEYKYKSEVFFFKGGISHFDYKLEPKGYYLMVTAMKGATNGSYSAMSSIKELLFVVQKRTEAKDEAAIKMAERRIPELINKIGSRIAESPKENMGSTMADGGMMADGGETTWRDAYEGDSALVLSENKMGVIIKAYGRKFHLKFVDGKEKTYDASELKFFKDADDFDMGGEVEEEGVDLFEDYENIPREVQEILDEYSKSFEDGDYKGLRHAQKALEKIGYTFDYYLDGEAYDLRKIGQRGKMEEYASGGMMAQGGNISKGKKWKLEFRTTDGEKGYHVYEIEDTKYLTNNYGGGFVVRSKVIESSDPEQIGKYSEDSKDFLKKVFMGKYPFASRLSYGGMMAKGGKVTGKFKDARYAKGKIAYHPPENNGRIKNREMRLAEAKGVRGKWSHRESAYIMSKSQAEKLKKYLIEGKDAEFITHEVYGKGGTTFEDKVRAIKMRLSGTKVPERLRKDYGKKYTKAEAKLAAKRIAGSIRAKENR